MEKHDLANLSLMGLHNLKKQIEQELGTRLQKAHERLSNVGFEIILSKDSGNKNHKIVLGKRDSKWPYSDFEFVTWRQFINPTNGDFFYESGNYFFDQNEALADFKTRE